MEAVMALAIGVLIGGGTYLLLRARTFPVVLGLILSTYGVNLFLFISGGLEVGSPPLLGQQGKSAWADPLPQAMVLTAIVISFAMTAFAIILALRSRGDLGTDHVDGTSEPFGRDE
jgi:multicomponent K+:H+ antiporter subunit C